MKLVPIRKCGCSQCMRHSKRKTNTLHAANKRFRKQAKLGLSINPNEYVITLLSTDYTD